MEARHTAVKWLSPLPLQTNTQTDKDKDRDGDRDVGSERA